jgi:hypothetical protein
MDRLASWLRLGAAVVCFMPDDPGGGAGGDTSSGGGGPDTMQGGGGVAWKEPDGLPDSFKGVKSADELVGKMLPAYVDLDKRFTGARETIAKLPAAAKTAEEYEFAPTDKTKAYFPADKDGKIADPFLPIAREVALKNGIPKAAFPAFINGIYEAAIEKGLLGAPYSETAEITSYKTAMGVDDKTAGTHLTEALGFAEGLFKQLKGIPEAVKADAEAALLALTDTAGGNIVLRALQGRLADSGIRIAGQTTPQGALTREDLKTLSSDPRIDPKNRHHPDADKRFDEALRKRYDEGYKALGNSA